MDPIQLSKSTTRTTSSNIKKIQFKNVEVIELPEEEDAAAADYDSASSSKRRNSRSRRLSAVALSSKANNDINVARSQQSKTSTDDNRGPSTGCEVVLEPPQKGSRKIVDFEKYEAERLDRSKQKPSLFQHLKNEQSLLRKRMSRRRRHHRLSLPKWSSTITQMKQRNREEKAAQGLGSDDMFDETTIVMLETRNRPGEMPLDIPPTVPKRPTIVPPDECNDVRYGYVVAEDMSLELMALPSESLFASEEEEEQGEEDHKHSTFRMGNSLGRMKGALVKRPLNLARSTRNRLHNNRRSSRQSQNMPSNDGNCNKENVNLPPLDIQHFNVDAVEMTIDSVPAMASEESSKRSMKRNLSFMTRKIMNEEGVEATTESEKECGLGDSDLFERRRTFDPSTEDHDFESNEQKKSNVVEITDDEETSMDSNMTKKRLCLQPKQSTTNKHVTSSSCSFFDLNNNHVSFDDIFPTMTCLADGSWVDADFLQGCKSNNMVDSLSQEKEMVTSATSLVANGPDPSTAAPKEDDPTSRVLSVFDPWDWASSDWTTFDNSTLRVVENDFTTMMKRGQKYVAVM